MRITQNTDHRLVIEHRPWALAGIVWLMGLAALYGAAVGNEAEGPLVRAFVGALGLAVCFAAWRWFAFLRITFDRNIGEVEHRAIRPFGTRAKYLALDRVLGARVEAQWSDGVRMTRLALETKDGRAQLEYGYSSGERRALEAAVNEWLTRPVAE